MSFPKITREQLNTLQVNLGYKCNQSCSHCHVDAGPHRKEMMNDETLDLITSVLDKYDIKTLDITGGAPELHPRFRELVLEARNIGVEVIDRCNLTILNEPGQNSLAQFLADNKVIITASLPCYEKSNVDKQRGKGVFESSLLGLKKLNELGYGYKDNNLIINLVYNPQGAILPPDQEQLEISYKRILMERYSITFNKLLTITNMPIKRFANHLRARDEFEEYNLLLFDSFNKENLETLMCKTLISVDWQGYLYDCDFNQQLGHKTFLDSHHLKDLLNDETVINGSKINVGSHCYGCTAGNGSSCGGALSK